MEQATFYTEFDQRRPGRLIIKVLGGLPAGSSHSNGGYFVT